MAASAEDVARFILLPNFDVFVTVVFLPGRNGRKFAITAVQRCPLWPYLLKKPSSTKTPNRLKSQYSAQFIARYRIALWSWQCE